MSRVNGWLQLRRGIWEHVRDGRMSTTEALAFLYICSEADTRNGIWKGSAKSLSGELNIRDRTARDVLERMERGDYIRRFPVPGRHVCYPILVHKYLITSGEHDGEQLNALDSKSPADLAYLPCEHDGERNGEHDGEHGASQKRSRSKKREDKEPRAAKPAAPADSRFQPFHKYAYESFRSKYGQPPTWNERQLQTLKALLGKRKDLTPAELERRWNHYCASTDRYHASKGLSLAHFCTNFDAFISGPILGATAKVGTNGTAEQRNDNIRGIAESLDGFAKTRAN